MLGHRELFTQSRKLIWRKRREIECLRSALAALREEARA
jgi:hypothetical protein